jgi:hypothetical protein
MTERKKKLRLVQICLLVIGTLLILFTYSKKYPEDNQIISKNIQEKLDKNYSEQNNTNDKFYDISYSNIDLNGNRFIIKSKEAESNKEQMEIVRMKLVEAIFYFKDGTELNVKSDFGLYNNRTLDIEFNNNIKAFYEGSTLLAQKANFSNSKSYLDISDNVTVKDYRGEISADKIFFDLKSKTLDIESFNNNKVNANINLQ